VHSLPVMFFEGTHSEVGNAIGQNFKLQIGTWVKDYDFLNNVLKPWYNTTKGQEIVNQFLIIHQQVYPNYMAELDGIANGSSIPFIDLFIMNLRYEFAYFANHSVDTPFQCADVHVTNQDNIFVAHNEDANPEIASTAFLLRIKIPQESQDFYAYTYPGYLPGMGFGWNQYVSFSFNYVGPVQTRIGLGRAFINRDALGSVSMQDAFTRITPNGRAFGYTLNLGDFVHQTSYSIEVSPNAFALYQNLNNFTHFNEYKLLNIPQIPDISTTFRQPRADMFPAPTTVRDALNILGDTMDQDWPIYRNAAPPDHAATVASVLFDLKGRNVAVWVNNPRSFLPLYTFLNERH